MEGKLKFKFDETYTYKFVYPNIKDRNQRLQINALPMKLESLFLINYDREPF